MGLWILFAGGALLPAQVNAALRAPQVSVLGPGLQAYLNSQGESINVGSDQSAIQRWGSTASNNATFSVQLEIGIKSSDLTFGLYNASDTAPVLYEIFTHEAARGWFAVASYRFGPTRVLVNLFDANAIFRGTTTYLGANKDDFGYYLSGPGGTFYSQDSRNPGGSPQLLVFAGTSVNLGAWWLAFEDVSLAGGGSDQDFDDTVVYVEAPLCPCPVQKCNWGALKSRFH